MSDNDLEPEATIDREEVQNEAREGFHLSDMLRDVNHRTDKVTLFLDLVAVDRYHELNDEAERLNDQAGKCDLKTEEGREMNARLIGAYNALEPKLDEAKALMLKKAVVILLKAWPRKVATVARRDARKKFNDPVLGRVPDDRLQDASEEVDMRLLGESIVEIRRSDGAIDRLQPYDITIKREGKKDKVERVHPRHTIGRQLEQDLPPSQYDRLYTAYQLLTLSDQIGKAATEDPGF